MRLQNLITALLFLSLTLTFISCQTSPNTIFSISSLDTTIKATKISISDLAKNYKSYQGLYIETKGQFYQGFEEFAIYTPKPFFGERKGFWLESDMALSYDSLFFANANGRKVTIKGVVDTTSKGHLSMYLATIRRIYFWEKH